MTETYYTESGRAGEDEAGDWTDRDAIRPLLEAVAE